MEAAAAAAERTHVRIPPDTLPSPPLSLPLSHWKRDPPCLAFFGDSHMMQHGWVIQELAREYDVSYLWLPR